MGLMKAGTFVVLCVILFVTVSGCLDQDIYGNKGPKTIEFTNNALNATAAVWNSSGHNSTIDNSSMYLSYVYSTDNERISTFHFNTTDGRPHTVNVSDYRNANSIVVLDIDNISITYPAPSQINFTANPYYLNTTGGIYNLDLTANVYNASGNPVVDGTIVNFNIHAPDAIFDDIAIDSPYNPFLNGSLNGNISQYASVPTIGGKAVVHYGWFPDNKIPSGFVRITAAINNTPSVKMTLYLVFNGTTQVDWTIIPEFGGISDATPSPM